MAKVGAQRAAELTGKSKSTIQRAMNSGKLSYEMDNNKRRIIDVSELERVYGLSGSGSSSSSSKGGVSANSQAIVDAELKKAADMIEMERMKMRIKALEEQLELTTTSMEDLREQRDKWQSQAQQVLITSQYSQKQAEDYKAELKTREEIARKRREKMMAERAAANKNQQSRAGVKGEGGKPSQENVNKSMGGVQDLWKKIKGEKTGT
jgi:hypothetical protein